MRFRGHEADITISDVSKSQEDDGRVCRFLSSTRLWCMPCDVCCNPTFKMLFKDFFLKIFPCVVPRLRYLSSSLFLPCCLPFYPFILSRPFSSSVGKRKTVFHLNCQTFTLKYIHSLPLRTHPKSTYIFISRFSLPTLSLPVLVWLSVHFSLFSDWFCSELWTWRRLNVGVLPLHKSLLSEFGSRPGSLHVTGRNP